MAFNPQVDFWDRVEKTEGCWPWKAGKTSKGYGQVTITGKTWRAHRRAWFLINGPIPAGLCVLHKCDNPPCCRPDHLFLGSHADNSADMAAKGRSARGDLHGTKLHPETVPRGETRAHSKLTAAQVSEILSRYVPGVRGVGPRSLAREFGVHGATIRDIISRRVWKHLPAACAR